MKKTYTATFSDGTTITRKTERTYTVAWRATWTVAGKRCAETGFAISRDKAKPYAPSPYRDRAANAALQTSAGYSVEFAEAVPA